MEQSVDCMQYDSARSLCPKSLQFQGHVLGRAEHSHSGQEVSYAISPVRQQDVPGKVLPCKCGMGGLLA